ncbi:methyl-accepting chemotaxis protein, partial [Nitrospira defluvii]|nr:methyl-accepting chemotaxis protein [Nitrospira defluvii]
MAQYFRNVMIQRFRNMSIQSKLISSTGVSLAAIILVWILIAKIINVSNHTFTQAKETLELSNAVSATTRSAQLLSEPIGKLLHDWNVLMAQEGFKKSIQVYQEKLQALKTLIKDEKDTRIVKSSRITEEGVIRIFALSEEIFLLADKKVTAEGEGKMFAAQAAMEEASEMVSEINTIEFEILETMTDTRKLLSERETLLFAESINTNNQFSYISITVLLMSVIITALVSFFIARSVSKPTKALQKAVKAVSEGILTYKIDIESYGEIGDLVHSFSTMVDSQRHLVTEVKNSSKQIASASNELSKSSQQMTSNSEEAEKKAEAVSEASAATNTNVQAVATASEEMLVTIKEISRNIQKESEITAEAVGLSKNNN